MNAYQARQVVERSKRSYNEKTVISTLSRIYERIEQAAKNQEYTLFNIFSYAHTLEDEREILWRLQKEGYHIFGDGAKTVISWHPIKPESISAFGKDILVAYLIS